MLKFIDHRACHRDLLYIFCYLQYIYDIFIYISGDSPELENKIDIGATEQWTSVNKLKMNREKTKFVIWEEQRDDRIIASGCSDGIQMEWVELNI